MVSEQTERLHKEGFSVIVGIRAPWQDPDWDGVEGPGMDEI